MCHPAVGLLCPWRSTAPREPPCDRCRRRHAAGDGLRAFEWAAQEQGTWRQARMRLSRPCPVRGRSAPGRRRGPRCWWRKGGWEENGSGAGGVGGSQTLGPCRAQEGVGFVLRAAGGRGWLSAEISPLSKLSWLRGWRTDRKAPEEMQGGQLGAETRAQERVTVHSAGRRTGWAVTGRRT